MIRHGLYARLKPGKLAEYKRIHDEMPTKWMDLVEALHAAGIHREVVFASGNVLFVYAEVDDLESYPRVFATEVHERWAELGADLMETGPDGLPDVRIMDNIWEIDTDALVKTHG